MQKSHNLPLSATAANNLYTTRGSHKEFPLILFYHIVAFLSSFFINALAIILFLLYN